MTTDEHPRLNSYMYLLYKQPKVICCDYMGNTSEILISEYCFQEARANIDETLDNGYTNENQAISEVEEYISRRVSSIFVADFMFDAGFDTVIKSEVELQYSKVNYDSVLKGLQQ